MINRNHIILNNAIGLLLDGGIYIRVLENNIFENSINAENCAGFLHIWQKNYWGENNIIIKIIQGRPINIDWYPAKEPYDL